MGYLTTVTVYNDGLSLLKKHPEEFCSKLYDAAISHEQSDFGVGNFCNFANVQAPRHADDHTIYVHMGNTLTEVNPWSKDFTDLLARHPDHAIAMINFLDSNVRQLKKLVKQSLASKGEQENA
jgi:hypothetical protein